MHHEVAEMLGIQKVIEEEVDGTYPASDPASLSLAPCSGIYERIGLEVSRAIQMRQISLPPLPFEFEVGWIMQSKNQLSLMACEYIKEIILLCTGQAGIG